jgi:hypothetical protein
MWYKSRPMLRRNLAVALLLIVAVQFLGSMAFAATCLEPCPDDTDGASCPPVCTLCTTCTHAQQATMSDSASAGPIEIAQRLVHRALPSIASPVANDIFHIPLPG